MRSVRFFAPLLLLLFAACKKETVVVNTKPQKAPFQISGLRDIFLTRSPFQTLAQNQGQQLPLRVTYNSGPAQRIALQVTLPAGLGAVFTTLSGYPDFATSLIVDDSLTLPAGTYKMQLRGRTDSGVVQQYEVGVEISGDTSCVEFFLAHPFQFQSSCDSGHYFLARMRRLSAGSNVLLLSNFRADGLQLQVVFDCVQKRIMVPTQVIGTTTYSGFGYLDLVYGNLPVYGGLQLTETTAGGIATKCNYGLWMQ